MMEILPAILNSVEIRVDSKGNICLTDLWKSAGENAQQAPAKWQETEAAKAFIKASSQILNIAKNDIIKSKRGKGGGTYAHKQIAIEYAQYLSPELAVAVNQVFFERLEEQQQPQLAIERAIGDWKRQGKTDEWISDRLRSKAQRNEFTTVLDEHGVVNNGLKDNGYYLCTTALYMPLFGGNARTIRKRKDLPAKANIRDNLNSVELAALMLSEAVAAENIKGKNLQGNKECASECRAVSANVASAISSSRKSQPHNIGQ